MITVDDKKYITREEACKILGLSPFTFYKLKKSGRIKGYGPWNRRTIYYLESDIKALKASLLKERFK